MFLKLLALLRALLNLPDVHNEAELRSFLQKVSEFLKWVVTQTPTTIDDTLANALEKCLSSDEAWGILYDLLMAFLPDDKLMISRNLPADLRINKLSELTGFDPATLIALIQAIIELLKQIFNWNAAKAKA